MTRRKTRTRKATQTNEEGVTSQYAPAPPYIPPATTRTMVYEKMPINKFTVFKYKEYIFKFDNKLDPIPVEVPSDIADILLEMVDEGCRCHASAKHKLFREIK